MTFYDPKKQTEVKNFKKIAINYIKESFFIDLLSTLPIDTMYFVSFIDF